MLFATGQEIKIPLEFTTKADLASQVRRLEWYRGATYTEKALRAAKAQIWEPTMSDVGRKRVTIVLSDAESTKGENPCSVVGEYVAAGIEVHEITLTLAQHKCAQATSSTIAPNMFMAIAGFMAKIDKVFRNAYGLNCEIETVITSFNGVWSRTSRIVNDYPVYTDKDKRES